MKRCQRAIGADDADRTDHFHPHHMQTSQALFPSSICAAALHIIQLLEDVQVNGDGVAGTYRLQYSRHSTLRTQYSGGVLRVPLLLLSPLNSCGKIINEKNDKFVSESAAEVPKFKRGCHLPLDVTTTISWSYSWCKEFTKKLDGSKWSPTPPRTLAAPAYVTPNGQTWLNYDIWVLKGVVGSVVLESRWKWGG